MYTIVNVYSGFVTLFLHVWVPTSRCPILKARWGTTTRDQNRFETLVHDSIERRGREEDEFEVEEEEDEPDEKSGKVNFTKKDGEGDSVQKMLNLEENNKIEFFLGQLKSLYGNNGMLESVLIYNDNVEKKIQTDFLIPFFGLKNDLGSIKNWNLNLENNLIIVDTEKFETNIPSIFSIGDINTYPGKLKLILSGFHEAALMSQKCAQYCFPDKKVIFRYTTSSKDIHKKLGIK